MGEGTGSTELYDEGLVGKVSRAALHIRKDIISVTRRLGYIHAWPRL